MKLAVNVGGRHDSLYTHNGNVGFGDASVGCRVTTSDECVFIKRGETRLRYDKLNTDFTGIYSSSTGTLIKYNDFGRESK